MIIDQFLSAIFEKVARTISLNNYKTDLRNQSKMKKLPHNCLNGI